MINNKIIKTVLLINFIFSFIGVYTDNNNCRYIDITFFNYQYNNNQPKLGYSLDSYNIISKVSCNSNNKNNFISIQIPQFQINRFTNSIHGNIQDNDFLLFKKNQRISSNSSSFGKCLDTNTEYRLNYYFFGQFIFIETINNNNNNNNIHINNKNKINIFNNNNFIYNNNNNNKNNQLSINKPCNNFIIYEQSIYWFLKDKEFKRFCKIN